MEKDKVQIALETLEHVYVSIKNTKMSESNKHEVNHPERVEHDLTELEKEHLALLRAVLFKEIYEKTNGIQLRISESSDRLGKKLFWLNCAMTALTFVLAASAVITLLISPR